MEEISKVKMSDGIHTIKDETARNSIPKNVSQLNNDSGFVKSGVTVAAVAPSNNLGLWVDSNTGDTYYYNGSEWEKIKTDDSTLEFWNDSKLQEIVDNNWQ